VSKVEELIEYLISYGALGFITAYFLCNDYKDRETYRQFMSELMNKVNEHERRITALEDEKK
jgi:hypothetical protein